jgi:hypothetical protein
VKESRFYADEEAIFDRLKKIRTDAWEFLKCVRTLDEVDEKLPIKPFPTHLEYLYLYCRVWERAKKVAVPKSRRMKLSWINIALYTWDSCFHVGRRNALVSKKEEDSDELIERAKFILENLDEKLLPKELLPKYEKTFNSLVFPEIQSKLEGFPSGADQLRQYTLSGIMADELAFWENAEEMYSASLPTIEGGGRFTGISSPAPGFFKRLVFDELDEAQGIQPENDKKYPMEGVEVWKNPKNGFTVFQIHYKADPAKRDPEYIKPIKTGMPIRKFRQEYELEWDTFEGLSVYADWDNDIHGVKGPIFPHIGLPILIGMDFGLTPAAIIAQYRDRQLVCMREFTAVNMGAERFLAWVVPQLKLFYPQWASLSQDYIVFIDPSGYNRAQTDETTCAQIVHDSGLTNIVPGEITWEARRTSVEDLLTRRTKDGPALQVSMPNCPVLTRGFQGGYRYHEKALEREPANLKPLKDVHSHIHDGLQMIASRLTMGVHHSSVKVGRPAYAVSRP